MYSNILRQMIEMPTYLQLEEAFADKPGYKGTDVEPTDGGATSTLNGSYGGKSSEHFIKKFFKLIYECPCLVFGCKRIFLWCGSYCI